MMKRRTFNKLFCFFLALMCLSGLWGCASISCKQEAKPPYEVQVVHDIPYVSEDDSPRHRLDIYYPASVKHPTVLFYVHGGAWRVGDKAMFANIGKTFAMRHGYTVVIPNFRLSNPNDGNAVHPDHINDIASAFAWVKKNIASHGGDPKKVFIFGHSSGAQIVSLLATDPTYLRAQGCDPSDIRGVISLSGIYNLPDMVRLPENPLGLAPNMAAINMKVFQNVFGGSDNAVLAAASARSFISANQPPFLVIYTEQDLPGLAEETMNYHAAVLALKKPEIRLERLVRSDFSEKTWAAAAAMAQRSMFADCVGHFAGPIAINPQEPDSRCTRIVADFIEDQS